MKREFSAGGVVHKRYKDPETQRFTDLFLVRRSSGGDEYRGSLGWTLPKGWIDAGETPEQAAIREVKEEGGVNAKIAKKLETIKIFFTDQNGEKVMKFITYYAMEFSSDLPEGFGWETAEVKWMNIEETQNNLAYVSEKKLVEKAFELVQSQHEEN